MAAAADSTPIDAAELTHLFTALSGYRTIFLAVSGGADSTALMHLVARWKGIAGQAEAPELRVLTVDHGLRPESAREARIVVEGAKALGLPAEVLTWQGALPTTAIQESARDIRYRLLIAAASKAGPETALVIAHHRDDLAETVLMRLARGAGVDGVAAMQPLMERCGIALLRPLLDVAKGRLVATLAAAAIPWIDDPSNANEAFERVSLRRQRAARDALGLSDAALALTARRMARSRQALEAVVDQIVGDCREQPLLLRAGVFRWSWLAEPAEDDIAIRLLARLLAAIGGTDQPPRLMRIERLYAEMQAGGLRGALTGAFTGSFTGSFAGATLGKCVVAPVRGCDLVIYREPNREALPEVTSCLETPVVWDNRFEIGRHGAPTEAFQIRALVRADLAQLGLGRHALALPCPFDALCATPVLVDSGGVAWSPALDVHRPDASALAGQFWCRFRTNRLSVRHAMTHPTWS